MSNNDASKYLPDPIEDKLSELNLKPKEEIDFSKAAAESERSSDNVQNGQHEGDHYIEGNEDSGDQTGKEKRRGSLERYKPPSTGNYSREEREKHRRRGHFGETKKQDDEPPDNKEKVGRSHGRFRGKGKGKENRNSYNGSQENQNDGKSKEDDSQGYGARGSYKSQLSKDWADYSFEDDAKPSDGSTTANNKSNTRKDDRAWGGTPEKESLTWQDEDRNQSRNHERRSDRPNPRHERNHNQRNDYRNQYEQPTDLRQKLNEKRAANPEYEHGSSENNFQAQNGNYNNGHRDNNRNRQKTSRGVVQSNWANKSEFERYSNDNGRGFKGNRNDRENKFNERHGNQAQSAAGNLPRPKKNTENFNPCHDPPEARILFATPGMNHYDRPHYSRDVIVVVSPKLLCLSIFFIDYVSRIRFKENISSFSISVFRGIFLFHLESTQVPISLFITNFWKRFNNLELTRDFYGKVGMVTRT